MSKDQYIEVEALDGSTVRFRSEEFLEFRKQFGTSTDAEQRISTLLWYDMFIDYQNGHTPPHCILDAISDLERGEPKDNTYRTRTKRSGQFKHPPLRGLWKKHYFAPASLPRNIVSELGGPKGLQKMSEQFAKLKISADERRARASGFAMKNIMNALEKRANKDKFTGEWLIFAKIGPENLYLSLGLHDVDHHFLHKRIVRLCVPQFPPLADIICPSG